jgi:hypothetical protein
MSIVRLIRAGGSTHLTPTFRAGAVNYSVRLLKAKPKGVVRVSPATEEAFRKISDPGNAHLFTAEAALEAFADVQV